MDENADTTVQTFDANLLIEFMKSAKRPSATTPIRLTDDPAEITTRLAIIFTKNFPNPLFKKKLTIFVIISTALPVWDARYVHLKILSPVLNALTTYERRINPRMILIAVENTSVLIDTYLFLMIMRELK